MAKLINKPPTTFQDFQEIHPMTFSQKRRLKVVGGKLRGHHLLCLLAFQGLGYNPEFVENTERVVRKFRSKPGSTVTLTTDNDIICSGCPFNKSDRCFKKGDSEERTKVHDLKVMELFGFKEGEKIKIGQAWKKIKNKITPKDLSKICPGCEWLRHCSNLSDFKI